MKASKVIEALQTLDPDEEIMVAWWERETVSTWFYDHEKLIDMDKWYEAVDRFDSFDLQETADDITRMVEEVLEEES